QNLTKVQLPTTNIQLLNITQEILLSTQSQNDTIRHSNFIAKKIKK
ncbi:10300_t:CDS:1, partial [Dentiscutata heterogama]